MNGLRTLTTLKERTLTDLNLNRETENSYEAEEVELDK